MTQTTNAKVYQEVLEQIRLFIDQHNLSPGDRLPSERYLAETLKAGRSSVREALRAIELLGIIETKQGEGTFLKAYQPFHTVELLSSFILRESRTKNELFQLKMLLEQQATKMIVNELNDTVINSLRQIVDSFETSGERHFYFFHQIFQLTNNNLLLKVWQLVEEFTRSVHSVEYDRDIYHILLEAFKSKNYNQIESIIEKLY